MSAQSQTDTAPDIIVGIDLGTTNSLIGYYSDDGPQLIPNASGELLTPSAVHLSGKSDLTVGAAARHRLVSDPDHTAARFKRFMGTQKVFRLGKTDYRAEELSAMILRSLKADAESHFGHPVTRAVISVPAYFNDLQRKATFAAGKLAGLKVERLINEPTAAALAYGVTSDTEETLLVLDLGGGTFDVSILEVFDGIMEVRSSAGDIMLGGEDFTDAVFHDFKEQIGDAARDLSPEQAAGLRALAEQAKIALGSAASVSPEFVIGETSHELSLTQDRFAELTKPLLDRLRRPIQRALGDAGLLSRDLDRVVLVGGATRMPIVRQTVTRLMKAFPEHGLDPDSVIALGAGVQAGLLSRHAALEDRVMTDVSPFTMGIATSRREADGSISSGHYQPIIERNMVVPISRVDTFSRMDAKSNMVIVEIYQGESPRVAENVRLGEVKLHLGGENSGQDDFDVRFTYDVSGVLEVIATVKKTGRERRLVIEGNAGAMSAAEIDKRLKALSGLKIRPEDQSANKVAIARCKALYENSLGAKRVHVEQAMSDFEAVLRRQVPREIDAAREQLTALLDELERSSLF